MLTASYINRLCQFGREEYDLCIFDDSGVEIRRFNKRFQEGVSPAEMTAYANEIMARVEADLQAQQAEQEAAP